MEIRFEMTIKQRQKQTLSNGKRSGENRAEFRLRVVIKSSGTSGKGSHFSSKNDGKKGHLPALLVLSERPHDEYRRVDSFNTESEMVLDRTRTIGEAEMHRC